MVEFSANSDVFHYSFVFQDLSHLLDAFTDAENRDALLELALAVVQKSVV